MEDLIKCIVKQQGRVHDITIYFSILIAYLEQSNWREAKKILTLIEHNSLDKDEHKVFLYLSFLYKKRKVAQIHKLSSYLSDC